MTAFYTLFRPRVARDAESLARPEKTLAKSPVRGVADRSAIYANRRSLTEQQIKDARAYHQWFNWTTRQCAEHFGVPCPSMRRLLEYINARNIEPRREDYPQGPTA